MIPVVTGVCNVTCLKKSKRFHSYVSNVENLDNLIMIFSAVAKALFIQVRIGLEIVLFFKST